MQKYIVLGVFRMAIPEKKNNNYHLIKTNKYQTESKIQTVKEKGNYCLFL